MRYFKFRECNKRNFSALENNKIYTNSIFNYNDPFEGACWVNPRQSLLEQAFGESNRNDLIGRINRRTCYCLSHSKSDDIIHNITMWSHYACNHTGFCIEYNKNLLKGFLKESDLTTGQNIENIALKIIYSDTMPDLICGKDQDNKTLLTVLKTKYRCWRKEKELRLVYRGKKGLKRIPEHSVKAIYLGCNISDDNALTLRQIANKLGVPCRQMERSGQSYKLTYNR